MPFLLLGPGVAPGQYGETDQRMVSTPISVKTGKPSHSKADFVPNIDDIGATLLHLFGIEDTYAVGFDGRRLDFLLT